MFGGWNGDDCGSSSAPTPADDFLFLFRLHFTTTTNQKMFSCKLYDWLNAGEGQSADCRSLMSAALGRDKVDPAS